MKLDWQKVLKRALGLIFSASGFVITWIFVKGTLAYVVFAPGGYTFLQQQQITTFVRTTLIVVYIFVLVIHDIFSGSSIIRNEKNGDKK